MQDRPDAAMLELAIARIETVGWTGYSVFDLEVDEDVPVAQLLEAVGDRRAIIKTLGRHGDAAMLAVDLEDLQDMTPRERVFELIMRRLDALAFARPVLRDLSRDRQPDVALVALGSLAVLVRRLSQVAGLPATAEGAWTAVQLGRVYVQTGRIWLDDVSDDKAATLAELDKRLSALPRLD